MQNPKYARASEASELSEHIFITQKCMIIASKSPYQPKTFFFEEYVKELQLASRLYWPLSIEYLWKWFSKFYKISR